METKSFLKIGRCLCGNREKFTSINEECDQSQSCKIIIINFKKGRQCEDWRGRFTPNMSKDLSPKVPTHTKKEEKGKALEDKKTLTCFMKPSSPTPS